MLSDLIKAQIYECVVMLAAGLFAGILRDFYELAAKSLRVCLFREIKKERLKKVMPVVLDWMGELLFFTVLGVAVFAFLYYCCFGELSFHAFFTFVLGVFLWKKFFCGIIQ